MTLSSAKINLKIPSWIFFILVSAVLASSIVMSERLTFPFITGRTFYLRAIIELTLPLYCYLLIANKSLRPNLKNPLSLAVLGFLLANILAAIFGANFGRSIWGNFERMSGVWQQLHMTLFYFYLLLLVQLGGNFFRWFLQTVVWVAAAASLY